MKNNIELRDFAKKFIGQGGYTFRSYCGLGSGSPWCNAFVTYILHKGGFASLYCNGKKQTYCPNSIKWCQNNLANIPIYLALPMDIVYFDWEGNGVPNHIGFAWERNTDQSLYTIEGNTSGGIVARRTRSLYNKNKKIRYIQAVFRPHYPVTFTVSKPLVVDGYFGYNSIAMLQKVLGIKPDGILGQGTVKALQKLVGVSQDGSWGPKTSKAVQKLVGTTVDGEFGPKSVKALQTWINKKANFPAAKPEKKPVVNTPAAKPVATPTAADKACAWAKKIAGDNSYIYVPQSKDDNSPANKCCVCNKYGKGKYHGFNCIRLVGAAYFHGAGIPIKSANHKLVSTDMANRMLKAKPADALKIWEDRNGKGWKVIKNSNKKIPVSQLKKGDILICYDKETSKGIYKHMAIYQGDGIITDANSSTGISNRKYSALNTKCLIAMRYVK